METLATQFCGRLERYRRRRQYKRLRGVATVKKNVKVLRLDGRGRKSWKIRVIPKVKLKIKSPTKLWKRLRDAYVDMMLRFAGNIAQLNNGNVFLASTIPKAPQISA